MIQRMCLGRPGYRCRNRVVSGRCAECRGARERQRGTPEDRGYGAPHRAARAAIAATLPAPCLYGDGTIYPGQRWVAAHVRDGQPEYGYGPSHPGCNERAKTRYRAVNERGIRFAEG